MTFKKTIRKTITQQRKNVLIAFIDMVADMEANKKIKSYGH